MPSRYCPLCNHEVDAPSCPTHGVMTVVLDAITGKDERLEAGTLLGERYRVESVLGQGGMGAVYLATQLSVKRTVAIKTLLPRLVANLNAVRRFYKEVQALSQLTHPNIVRVYDFGIDTPTGVPFIVMEHLRGAPLSALLRDEGALDERRAARLLGQVASGLVEAHQAGIVHRDLKPSNIMVRRLADGDESVRVLDFGLVKVTGSGEDTTSSGFVLGTPLYISPEQITTGPIGPRTDLYALGCVLHHCLCGRPPYDGDALALIAQHVQDPAPPLPASLVDGAAPSEGLVALHRALLRKERLERPASTENVARFFKALARGEAPPLEWLATSSVDLGAGEVADVAATQPTVPFEPSASDETLDRPPAGLAASATGSAPTEPTRAAGRARWLWVAAVVALGGLGAWLALQGGQEMDPPVEAAGEAPLDSEPPPEPAPAPVARSAEAPDASTAEAPAAERHDCPGLLSEDAQRLCSGVCDLEGLREDILDAGIPSGLARKLVGKLGMAIDALQAGDEGGAVAALERYVFKVVNNAGSRIPLVTAQGLVRCVQPAAVARAAVRASAQTEPEPEPEPEAEAEAPAAEPKPKPKPKPKPRPKPRDRSEGDSKPEAGDGDPGSRPVVPRWQ